MTGQSDWTGRVGHAWATEWRRTDRSFAGLSSHLNAAIIAAAPDGPHRTLDIGCGAGETTRAIAVARPDATVIGVDLSVDLVATARARWHLPNLRFETGDAILAAAAVSPDLLVSRHGVMFFADPVAAFSALASAARPDARLIFSCFAERSANRFAADLLGAIGLDGEAPADLSPGPFAFADPAHVAGILSAAGWAPDEPTRVPFAYRAGEGDDPVADAVSFFSRIGAVASAIHDAPTVARPALLNAVTAACEQRCRGHIVDFPAVAWIWSARARGQAA